MRAETRRVLDLLGCNVDANALIGSLSIAEKQMVEIAKAISRDARIVFMLPDKLALWLEHPSVIEPERITRLDRKGGRVPGCVDPDAPIGARTPIQP